LFCASCGLTRRQSEEQAGRRLVAWYPFLHAHHDDYSEPLVVRWLCNRCYGAHHYALKARLKHPDQRGWMRWAHWKPLAKDPGGIPRAHRFQPPEFLGFAWRLQALGEAALLRTDHAGLRSLSTCVAIEARLTRSICLRLPWQRGVHSIRAP
jgi:hypothetical protein